MSHLKSFFGSRSARKKRKRPLERRLVFETLEPRILLSSDLAYIGTEAFDLTLRLDHTDPSILELIDNKNNGAKIATQLLSETSAVLITGSAANDKLSVDFANPFSVLGGIFFSDDNVLDQDSIEVKGKANTWRITGADTGNTDDAVHFSGIGHLIGGGHADDFVFLGGDISGTIDGGTGSNTLDYSNTNDSVYVDLATGDASHTGGVSQIQNVIGSVANDNLSGDALDNVLHGGGGDDTFVATAGNDTIDGGLGSDSLQAQDTANIWRLSGINTGTLNSQSFSAVEKLQGGADSDQFIVHDGAQFDGNVAGGLGSDTLDYSAYSTAVTVDRAVTANTTAIAGFTGIEVVQGGNNSGDTLVAANNTNTWHITAENAGDIGSAAAFAFSGFENLRGGSAADNFIFDVAGAIGGIIDGAGGNDTLQAADKDNLWQISGSDSGTLNGQQFVAIENLIGGALADTFEMAAAGSISGSIDGGGGNDTVIASALDNLWELSAEGIGSLNGQGFWGMENFKGGSGADRFSVAPDATGTIDGGGGNDTLAAVSGANEWAILGNNSGTLANLYTLSFADIENLEGGSGSDRFALNGNAAITGTIDGGLGNNILDYASATLANGAFISLSAGISAATATGGIRNIQTLRGSDKADHFKINLAMPGSVVIDGTNGSDILELEGGDNDWTLSGSNSGGVGGHSFTNVENLTGGSGTDNFIFNGGSISGSVDGAVGNDTLDYTSDTLGVSVDLMNGSATHVGSIANIESVITGSGNDSVVGALGALNLDLSTGSDSLDFGTITTDLSFTLHNDSTVSVSDGIETVANISGAENIIGGSGTNTYIFEDGASLAGTLSGTGQTVLDYTAYTTAVTVNIATGSATGTAGAVNVINVIGGSGNDTLVGHNTDNTWNITGLNSGQVGNASFSAIENLSGGSAADSFVLSAGATVSGMIEGGRGSDTLRAADTANTWTIAGLNAGTLNSQSFLDIENLSGGAIEDSFILAGEGMITGLVDGRQGQDRLKGDASADYTWDVTALNEGQVKGISFADFEFLEGGAGNKDTFVIAQDAGVSGTVEGGDAGYDTVVLNGDYAIVSSVATDDDAGILTLDGVDLVFDGMEPVVFNGGLGVFVYDGSNSGDNITVSAPVAMGDTFQISGVGETIVLTDTDTLMIRGLDGFDSVTFSGAIDFGGADIQVSAETITIDNTAVLTGIGDFTLIALDDASLSGSLPMTLPDAVAAFQDVGGLVSNLFSKSATIDIEGSITADLLSATARTEGTENGIVIPLNYFNDNATIDVTGATINVDTLSLSAERNTTYNADGEFAVNFIGGDTRVSVDSSDLNIGIGSATNGSASLTANNSVTVSAISDGIGSISAAWNVVTGSTTAYISNSSTVNVEDGNLLVQAIANADVNANVSLADNTGSDLATNGTFDSDTGWTKGTGWTIDSGVASSDGSQGGDSDLSQTILTNAKTYLVTYTISNYSAGTLTAVAGSTIGNARNDNGTYTEVITANDTDFKLRASEDFVGSVDDMKVQEVTGGSGGLFAVNNLRGDVEAYIVDSTATTTNSAGAVIVDADNTGSADAVVEFTGASGDSSAVGGIVAFNAVGWDPGAAWVETLDTLLGTNLMSADPADTRAYVRDSGVNAIGLLTVDSSNTSTVNADISNFSLSGDSSSMSTGLVLAINRVDSTASAEIRDSGGADETVTAGGVTVSASNAGSSITSSTVLSSRGQGAESAVAGAVALNDLSGNVTAGIYDITVVSNSGNVSVTAVSSATVTAIVDTEVETSAASSGRSSEGDSSDHLGFSGTVASNVIRGGATATVNGSDITTNASGDVTVQATNSMNLSATAVNAVTTKASGAEAVGVTLAFNTIGWQATNILFSAIDTLLGDPLIADAFGSDIGADASASVVDSVINAAGMLTVAAASTNQVNSTIRNYTTASATKKGSQSLGLGLVLSMNKVSSGAEAYIEYTLDPNGATEDIQVGNGITVSADDDATITSTIGLDNENLSSDSDVIGVSGAISLNDIRGGASAYVTDATILANAGGVAVSATERSTLTSLVEGELVADANAEGKSGDDLRNVGSSAESLAVNGVIATNLIQSGASAYIADSNVTTHSLGDVTIDAHNTSAIDATLNTAADSGDVAVGVNLAFNTVGWESQNFLFNTIDALIGDPLIADALGLENPDSAQAYVKDSTIDAAGDLLLTAVNDAQINATVSNAASSEVSATFGADGVTVGAILASNRVSSDARAYIDNSTTGGEVQAAGNLKVRAESNAGVYANSRIVTSSVVVSDGGVAVAGDLSRDILPFEYLSSDTNVSLAFGDRVWLADDFDETRGTPGGFYQYMGDDFSAATPPVDLNTQDYTDLGYWKPLPDPRLDPDWYALVPSDANSVGGMVVLNEVRSDVEAYLLGARAIAPDIAVEAARNATIEAHADNTAQSSGASAYGAESLAVNGTIATNVVRGDTNAYIANSDVAVTTGNLLVDAEDTSTLEAGVSAATDSGSAGDGVIMAFNAIGWEAQFFLFNAIDTLAGNPLISNALGGQDPADVQAYISNSTADVAGTLDVNATSNASIDAQVDNRATTAVAANLGTSGMSVAAALASNMVNSAAWAYIDQSSLTEDYLSTDGTVDVAPGDIVRSADGLFYEYVGAASAVLDLDDFEQDYANNGDWERAFAVAVNGGVRLTATDNSTIVSSSNFTSRSTVASDGGPGLLGLYAEQLLADYDFTTRSGIQAVNEDDLVRLDDAYAGGGTPGSVYRYQGSTGASIDLGVEDFTSPDWFALTADDPSGILPGDFDIDIPDATAIGGLVVLNDVRGAAESYIKDSVVSSVGDLTVKADQTANITASVDGQSEAYDVAGTSFGFGGVIASNVAQSHAKAYVSGGQASASSGKLIVDGQNNASIDAIVDNYVESNGASVGVTLAFNTVGWETNFGFNFLDVFTAGALSLGDETQDQVNAWIGDSARVDADNGVDVTAKGNAVIDAVITSAASTVNATAPSTSNVSVGAVVALNKISVDITASIDGAASVEAALGDIMLDATDNASIDATIEAATSAWADDVDVATTYSISANVARNEVRSDTQAFIRNSGSAGNEVRAANGSIIVDARQDAGITSTTRATSVAGVDTLNPADEGSASLSVGGALAFNAILGSANAFLQNSVVEAAGSAGTVTITAANDLILDALVESAAESIAEGEQAGSDAYAFGASFALNYIGYSNPFSKDRIQTAAYIQGGNVSADAGVTLSATSDAAINARVAASLTAIGANLLGSSSTIFTDPFKDLPEPSATAAGGVLTFNWVATDVQAYIDGVNGITTDASDILVTARDSASVTVTAEAQAIATELVLGSPESFLFRGAVGGTAIGMSLAFNGVDSNVKAYLSNPSGIEIGGADVTVKATSSKTVTSTATASALAEGISGLEEASALSGGGAFSLNQVLGSTTAYIEGGVLGSDSDKVGKVDVDAIDSSKIEAKVGATADSLAISLFDNASASGFGISGAVNLIGSGDNRLDVSAYLKNASVHADAAITVDAQSNLDIDALVEFDAKAFSVGGINPFSYIPLPFGDFNSFLFEILLGKSPSTSAFTAGGVVTWNSIKSDVSAYIEGSGSEGVNAPSISLEAKDSSRIDSVAETSVISAAFTLANGSSTAIGLTFAGNEIDTRSSAYILNAPAIHTGGGDVVIKATDSRHITSEASAAAITGSLAAFDASSVAGGGSFSMNTVLGASKAYIEGSAIGSDTAPVGTVDIDAVSNAEIRADIASAATAVALSGSNASATSIGFAGALNRIGTSGNALQVSAWIKNSDVAASGAITVDAVSNQNIDADVDAGAVSISASAANPSLPDISLVGLLGLIGDLLFGTSQGASTLSVGGIYAQNEVHSNVTAFIEGVGPVGITAPSVSINAEDMSQIDAFAEAVAVGAGLTLGSGSSTGLGLSIAFNEIHTDTAAYLLNTSGIDTGTGDIVLAANDTRTISADAIAAAFVAGGAVLEASTTSGGGAYSQNTVLGSTKAYVKGSVVGSATLSVRNLDIDASSTSTIEADISSVSTSVALGAAGASATGIGFSAARNFIGEDGDRLETQAWLENSSLEITGELTVDALANQTIDANVDALVASISAKVTNASLPDDPSLLGAIKELGKLLFGEGAGSSSLAAGGVYAENAIHSDVAAYIDGSGSAGVEASRIALTANDTSTVDAVAEAVAIGAALTVTSGSSTVIGVSIARNLVDSNSAAYIVNADQVDTAAGGSVTISATDTRLIEAEATAAGVSAGLGFDDASALSGGGAYAENKILGSTKAYIKDSVIGSVASKVGIVDIDAHSNSTIDADILATSVAAAISATGASATSIGFSAAINTIGEGDNRLQVDAWLENSSIHAAGAITVDALGSQVVEARVDADAVSVGFSAGQDSKLSKGVFGVVKEFILGESPAASGLAVGGVFTINDIKSEVKAWIDGTGTTGTTGITAPSIQVTATDTSQIDAESEAVAVAVTLSVTTGSATSIGVGYSSNLVDTDTAAYVINAGDVDTAGGDIVITATDSRTITSEATSAGVSAGLGLGEASSIAGGGAYAENRILGSTAAYVQDSTLGSDASKVGAVDIDASSDSTIRADILSVGVAVSVSGSLAGAKGLGLSGATNAIGADGNALAVNAWVKDSDIHANGSLTIDALAEQDIDAKVDAAAVSFAASAGQPLAPSSFSLAGWVTSLFGLIDAEPGASGLSVAGVYSANKLYSDVSAFIDANGAQGINAASVELHASDNSTITAESEAVAVGVGLSVDDGAAKSVGAGWATNLIDTNSSAYIVNVTDIDTGGGDVVVSAADMREIVAEATAAAIAAGLGADGGSAWTGAGAYAKNTILGSTVAHATDSVIGDELAAIGALDIDASSASVIDARILAASASVAAGETGGTAIGLGFTWAENEIGTDSDNLEVSAYLFNSSVHALGAITADAVGDQDIDATVVAGAIGIAASGGGGGIGSWVGAGSVAFNTVKTDIEAFISGSGASGLDSGSITLNAWDMSSLNADTVAASVAANFAPEGTLAVAIGVAFAKNVVANNVQAYITGVTDVDTGDIRVEAKQTGAIDAASTAVGVSGAFGETGLAISGGGSWTDNYFLTRSMPISATV